MSAYYFFAVLLFFSNFIMADQCVCEKEFVGALRRIVPVSNDELPAVTVDTKAGNYFVLTNQDNFAARIFDSSGKQKIIFRISSELVISKDVAFSSSRNRYLVVWSSLLQSSEGEHAVVRAQFRNSSGKTIGSTFSIVQRSHAAGAPSEIQRVQLLYVAELGEYLLAYTILENSGNIQNVPTVLFQRLNEDGKPVGPRSAILSGVHTEEAFFRYDPTTNHYLIAWDDQGIILQSVTRSLRRVGRRLFIREAAFPDLVFSGRIGSFVVFYTYPEQSIIAARIIGPNGNFAGESISLFRGSRIFDVRTNPVDGGFLMLYPRYTTSFPELFMARLNHNLEVVEREVPFACATLTGVRAGLIFNPVSTEFLADWAGSEKPFGEDPRIYLRRIRAVPTGKCF